MLDGKATARAIVDNAREQLRQRRLVLATAGPRREAHAFLKEAQWNSAGLVSYEGYRTIKRQMFWRATHSGRIDRSELSKLHSLGFGDRHHPFYDELPGADYWQLLLALADPCVFNPPAYWSLLWALLIAEQTFQTRWVDAWSHEERLTGHFLTTIADAGQQMASSFASLDRAWGGGAQCSVDYVDTATARREKTTGADFGVIVHGSDADHGEWLKVASFQVKKCDVPEHFEIDFAQLRALLSVPGLGFYLMFAKNDPSAPPPLVTPANDFESELRHRIEEREKAQPRATSETLGSQRVGADMAEDWAFHLGLGLADPRSRVGLPASSPNEAARLLLRQTALPPSRILAFGLGAMAGGTDWRQVVRVHDRDG